MADEPIQEQMERAEPKGPFHPKLSRLKILASGKVWTVMAAAVVGLWIMTHHAPIVANRQAPAQQQVKVVDDPSAQTRVPPGAGSRTPGGSTGASDQGVDSPNPNGTASASTTVQDDPIKTAKLARLALLREASFESNIVAEEKPKQEGNGENLPTL